MYFHDFIHRGMTMFTKPHVDFISLETITSLRGKKIKRIILMKKKTSDITICHEIKISELSHLKIIYEF